MNFKTGKIRKNAKIMINKLLDMSTVITKETYSMWLDDSMRSNGKHRTSANSLHEWMDSNYGEMQVYLSCDSDGKPESLRIGGEYHWSDEFMITFEAKKVIRAFTEEYYKWLNYVEPVSKSDYELAQEAELNIGNDKKEEQSQPQIKQEEREELVEEVSSTVVEFKKPRSSFISYMKTLIEEKGRDLDDEIKIDGHFGFTYQMLIERIAAYKDVSNRIKDMLVAIDFKNGDIFHFLDGMAKSYVDDAAPIH